MPGLVNEKGTDRFTESEPLENGEVTPQKGAGNYESETQCSLRRSSRQKEKSKKLHIHS